ncbi:sensor histidine kinase [Streptomyces erythrochromogenes]|uniref:sensor histidine kinase n=1 Tax=Streptomyces erythrochromogenes TaxID=285574 RepID=UPI0036BF5C00
MSVHLRFAPEILARLGEELIPHPDLGVMELVRNSYDADATWCDVTLVNATRAGGTLVVSDNGHGMTPDEIAGGFLHIGRSSKSESKTTSHYTRRKVGEKGLGRLASLRLGREIEVITRPASTPGMAYRLTIDWSAYENVDSVDEVPLEVQKYETSEEPGTKVIIKRLREKFDSEGAKRLGRSLLLLSGAFSSADGVAVGSGPSGRVPTNWNSHPSLDPGFVVTMDAPEYLTLTRAVSQGYFDEHEFKLTAELDADGQASAVLADWRGEVIASAGHRDVALPRGNKGQAPARFAAPPTKFELWMFLRDAESFKRRNSSRSLSEVTPWLDVVGGVHLFHRGLRTHPYGDPGHDWLDLNLGRNRDPQQRPSTNNSVGRVVVEDPENLLVPKTDRMGFQENLPFSDLREFAQRAVEWSARVRKSKWEDARSGEVAVARQEKKRERADAERIIRSLPPLQAAPLRRAFETNDRLIAALERDRLLYRALATVGISTAVFAHESLNTAGGLGSDLELLEHYAQLLLDETAYAEKIEEPLDRAQRSAASIHSFAKLPLRMLRRGKRRIVTVNVNEVCLDFVEMFGGYLKDWQIDLQVQLCADTATVRSTVADIESLYANLVINSARAFGGSGELTRDRIVRIRTAISGETVVIDVADSGPGISGIEIAKIWEPGEGSDEDGTGLGLTIVKDIVADLHGKKKVLADGDLIAAAHGDLGGAQFTIRLPRQMNTAESGGR